MKGIVRTGIALLFLAYAVGSDGLMERYGIAGYVGTGLCLAAAWVLAGLAGRVEERLNHRYRGRRN